MPAVCFYFEDMNKLSLKAMNRETKYGIIFLLIAVTSFAQTPDFYPPTVPEQIEITLFNIILYVIVPLLIIAAYFLYKKSQKKRRDKKKNEKYES